MKKFQDKLGEAGTVAEESLSSVRTVRSFSGEPKTIQNYSKEIDESYRIGKLVALAQGILELVITFIFCKVELSIAAS